MEKLDNSFSDEESLADVNDVMVDMSFQQEQFDCNPIKKLSDTFEGCVKDDACLKVYLRVRPIAAKQESTITVDSQNTIITHAPESSKRAVYTKLESRHYMFSRVFGPHASQSEVFDLSTTPLTQRFFSGDNCVLFAYGMTNAGKTHTIQGSAQHPGILPRLVSSILEQVHKNANWMLEISMLEIYQEHIYDLLGKKKTKLSIRDANGRVEVSKLSSHSIASTEDAFKLMDIASTNRSKSSTFLNNGSSRSHAVYTLTLHRPPQDNAPSSQVAFQLVDLAGAERGNRTKATATQQKEANNINTSLMQLWRCLHAVKRKNNDLTGSMEVIPFRESKLTHLLMPILSRAGLGGVAMITCVSPHGEDYDETLSILNNASLASKIREFADVGRTAGHVQPNAPPAPAPVSAASAPPRMISLEDLKDFKDKQTGKRRRQESTLAPPKPSRGAKASLLSGVNHILQNIQNISNLHSLSATNTANNASNANKETQMGKNTVQETAEETTESPSVAALQKEIARLKEANKKLMNEAIDKESEIREEVCKEMAQRSEHLLNIINDLRNELYEKEETDRGDITKSCKKARHDHMSQQSYQELSRALEEAEEELERLKSAHEEEIEKYEDENERLRQELATLKMRYQVDETHVPTTSTTNTRSVSEFSFRFNKKVEDKGGVKKSPNRSPLSPIQPNVSPAAGNKSDLVEKPAAKPPVMTSHAYIVNSSKVGPKLQPVQKVALVGHGQQSSMSSASPQRLRGETNANGVPYFTRLRSHFVR